MLGGRGDESRHASGLKLESESVVEAEETFEATDTLTDREREALSLILAPGGCSVEALQKRIETVGSGNFAPDRTVEWNNELGDIGRGHQPAG